MTDELIERPQDTVDAVATSWAKHHADVAVRDEIIDRAQRFAEVLAADDDAIRRAVAAELIEIVGTPT